MGALWSEQEEVGAAATIRFPNADPAASLSTPPVDRGPSRPYDAAATEARPRSTSGQLGVGLWLGEGRTVRRFGSDRLKRLLRFVLHTDDTPVRAALAFALGVFIAWTPIVGLHTLIALGLAFLFGLNRVAVLAGTFVNNPWTFLPIYSASAYLGSLLTGSDAPAPRLEGLSTWSDVGDFLSQCQPWIVPLTAGTLILGTFCALLSFPLVLYGIRWYRTLRRVG